MLEKTARPSRSTRALGLAADDQSGLRRAAEREGWTSRGVDGPRWLLLCVGEESALLDGEERLLQGTGDSICTQVVGMNSDSRTSSDSTATVSASSPPGLSTCMGQASGRKYTTLMPLGPSFAAGISLCHVTSSERERQDINYRSAWMNEFDFQLQTSFGATSIARTRPTQRARPRLA